MKNKILILIIGVLIGAIITTVVFLIYNKTIQKNSNNIQMYENRESGRPSNENMRDKKPNQNGGISLEIPSNSNNHNI